MNIKHILPFIFIIILAGCSSAYRIGQTPDDVYYSPAPPQDGYVTSDNQQDRDSYAYNNDDNMENLSIRRGISDPIYRSEFSLGYGYNYGYGYNSYNQYGLSLYNPYDYNQFYTGSLFYSPYYYNSFNNPYYYSTFNNPYYGSFYAPYAGHTVYANTGYSPRQYNMGVYNTGNTGSGIAPRNNNAPVRTFTRQTQQPVTTGSGNGVIRITPQSSTPANTRTFNNDNNYTPSRQTNSMPSNNNSSSSGNSGGSAPVRTFRHP